MKCPHCEYEDGWNADELKIIDGDSGQFYTLPDMKMERKSRFNDWGFDKMDLYACPCCKKTFIDN